MNFDNLVKNIYLKKYRWIIKQIKLQKRRLDELIYEISSIKAANYQTDVVDSSFIKSDLLNLIEKLSKQQKELVDNIHLLIDEKETIKNCVANLDDLRLTFVLEQLYFENKTIQCLSEEIESSETTIYRYKNEALNKLQIPYLENKKIKMKLDLTNAQKLNSIIKIDGYYLNCDSDTIYLYKNYGEESKLINKYIVESFSDKEFRELKEEIINDLEELADEKTN